jgi:glutamate 5-kinase
VLLRLAAGDSVGTRFPATVSHIESRKRWLLAERAQGTITVDNGAVQALLEQGRSLLAVGVTDVSGDFRRGETVRLCDTAGREIARGLVNYDAADLAAIRGHQSDEIATILGYQYGATVVHRDDLALCERVPANGHGENHA